MPSNSGCGLADSPYEFPRVVGLIPEVTIRLPVHFRAGTIPDETRVALSCGEGR
jgi:hypothetical protein